MKRKPSIKAEIFNILRLTTSFGETANLKPNIFPERALKKLAEYEKTELTPSEILQMKETIYHLQERLRKMEDW